MSDSEQTPDALRSIRVTQSPPSVSMLTERETPAVTTVVEPVGLLGAPVAVLGGVTVGTRLPEQPGLVYRHPAEMQDSSDTDAGRRRERLSRSEPEASPGVAPTGPSTAGPTAEPGSGSPGVPMVGHRPLSVVLSTADSSSRGTDPGGGQGRQHSAGPAGTPTEVATPGPELRYRPRTTTTDATDEPSPDRTTEPAGTGSGVDTTAGEPDTGTASHREGETVGRTAADQTPGSARLERSRAAGVRGGRGPAGVGRTRVERLVERRHAGDGFDPREDAPPAAAGVETADQASTAGPGDDPGGATERDATTGWPALATPPDGSPALPATPPPESGPRTELADDSRPTREAGTRPPGPGFTHLAPPAAGGHQRQTPATAEQDTPTPGGRSPGFQSPTSDATARQERETAGQAGHDSTTDLAGEGTDGVTRTHSTRAQPEGVERPAARPWGAPPSFTHLSPGEPAAGDSRDPSPATEHGRTGDTPTRTSDTTAATRRTTGLADTVSTGGAGGTAGSGDRREVVISSGVSGVPVQSQTGAGRTVRPGRERPSFTHLAPGEPTGVGGQRQRTRPTDRKRSVDRLTDTGGSGAPIATDPEPSEQAGTVSAGDPGGPPMPGVAGGETTLGDAGGTEPPPQARTASVVGRDWGRSSFTHLSPGESAGDSRERAGARSPDTARIGDRPARSADTGTVPGRAASETGAASPGGVGQRAGEAGVVESRSGDIERETAGRRSPSFTHLSLPAAGESGQPGSAQSGGVTPPSRELSVLSTAGREGTRQTADRTDGAHGGSPSAGSGRVVGAATSGPMERGPTADTLITPDGDRTTATGRRDGPGTARAEEMSVLSSASAAGETGTTAGKDLIHEGTQNTATRTENMPSLTLQSTGRQRSGRATGRQRGSRSAGSQHGGEATGTEHSGAEPTPPESDRRRQTAGNDRRHRGRTAHARRVEQSLEPGSEPTDRSERQQESRERARAGDGAPGTDLTVETLAPRFDATHREDSPRDITHTDRTPRDTRQSRESVDVESLFRAVDGSRDRPPADVDQVVERLYRRIERKMRIERERRGL